MAKILIGRTLSSGTDSVTVPGVATDAGLASIYARQADGSAKTEVTALPAGLATGAKQDTGNTSLAAINTGLGTDGAAPPALVGTGIRGWLRAIYTRLLEVLGVDVSDRAARILGHVVVDNFPGPDEAGLTNTELRAAPVPVIVKSSTGDRETVPASTTVVTLLEANADRRGAVVFNDSTAALYIALGPAASLTDFTDVVAAAVPYFVPYGYTGEITGVWVVAVGNARVTEVT